LFVALGLLTAFQLSVAQTPPPSPELEVSSPSKASKGVPFMLNISAVNKGGRAYEGSTISVSTPDSEKLDRQLTYNNIESLSCSGYCITAEKADIKSFEPGSRIWSKDGDRIRSDDLLIEGSPDSWASGKQKYMNIVFVPEKTGKIRFYVRASLKDSSDQLYNAPENSSFRDQQGYKVRKIEIDVSKRYSIEQAAKAGFYHGDICYEDPSEVKNLDCSQITEEHPIGYTAGQMTSGIAFFGDLRDFEVNSESGNGAMALLSIVGVVPGGGDFAAGASDSSRVLSKFSDRFPSKTDDLASIVSRLNDLGKPAKIRSLDDLYDGAASALRSQGIPDEKVIEFGRLSDGSFDLKTVRNFIDKGGESAKRAVRQLKPEETKRLLSLPEKVSRQLADNIDEFRYIDESEHGTEIFGIRHGVLLEVRYIDNPSRFFNSVEELGNVKNIEDLSKAQLGEAIAEKRVREIIKETGREPKTVIRKGYDGNVHSNGIDIIYRDPDTNELVVEEVKFSSTKNGNSGAGLLDKTENGRQMDEEWLNTKIENEVGMNEKLADELREAQIKGNLRKELTVTQNRAIDGKTITSKLNSDDYVHLDKVNLIKTGKVR